MMNKSNKCFNFFNKVACILCIFFSNCSVFLHFDDSNCSFVLFVCLLGGVIITKKNFTGTDLNYVQKLNLGDLHHGLKKVWKEYFT